MSQNELVMPRFLLPPEYHEVPFEYSKIDDVKEGNYLMVLNTLCYLKEDV